MKRTIQHSIIAIFILVTNTAINAQEEQSVLSAPDNWQSETFLCCVSS